MTSEETRHEEGQTLVEYCLMMALVVGMILIAFPPLAGAVAAAIGDTANALAGAL